MPEKSHQKDNRLDLRVTSEQKELLERAAALRGVSVSAYTLLHIMPIAKQEIDTHERLVLSDRDRDLFMSLMENPPPMSDSLKSAMQKYREKYDR